MIFMKQCRFFFLVFSFLLLVTCKGRNSVRDLYKFANTKDVLVQVNIDYLSSSDINPTIDFSGRSFLLNAFALDADGVQVTMSLDGSDSIADLPVTLTSSRTSLDIIMRLPISVQPGPGGYALRFQLKESATSLRTQVDVTENLDALRSDVKAGTTASENRVDLSIASTVAYQLIKNANADFAKDKTFSTYSKLVEALTSKQGDLELLVDVAATHSVSAYLSGMISALGYKLISDKALQATIVDSLLDAVQDGIVDEAEKTSDAETFAKNFTSLLSTLAQNAKTNLGDRTLYPAKVFTSEAVNTSSLTDPNDVRDAVFAPSGIAFTDTDATTTLGGNISITPPLVNRGIASYNIYFGGEKTQEAPGTLVGNVSISGSSIVSLSLPSGTAQLSYTRFWAFPVAAGGELNLPVSVAIINVGGSNNPPSAPTNVAATAGFRESAVSWTSVSGATSYNIYWSTVSPATTSSSKIPNATSPYVHVGLTRDQTYYYVVTAIKNSRESAPSTEASVVPVSSGPATPKALAAKAGTGLNTVTWQATEGATSYNLYWSTSNNITKTSNKLAAVTSPYQHTGLSGGTSYYYAIAAVTGGVEGRLSASVMAQPLLAAPTTLTAAGENGSNLLDWTPVTGATSYNIYWSTNAGVSKNSTTITAIQRPYRHKGLSNGTNYYYAVTAIASSVESELSSEVNSQPEAVPFAWIGALSSSTATSGWSTSTTTPASAPIDGGFNRPISIAVDAKNGYFYTGEHSQSGTTVRRVSKFNLTTGVYLGSIGYLSASTGTCPASGVASGWCTGGSFASSNTDGGFVWIGSVEVDPATDTLYVSDWGGHKISKFVASTGAFVGSVGYVSSVAAGGTCIAGAVASSWCRGGTFSASAVDGGLSQTYSMAVDSTNGLLYIHDAGNFRIVKMQTSGEFIGAVGKTSASTGTCPSSGVASSWCTGGTFVTGSEDGAFTNTSQSSMAIDVENNQLYYTPGGYFVTRMTLSTGAFGGSVGITSSSSGTCPSSGATTTWCTGGTFSLSPNDGGFATALGLDVDPINGWVYVGDGLTYRLKRLTATTGVFNGAKGVVTASSGTCPATGATSLFCTGGTFSQTSPTLGTFRYISGIRQAENGYIYASDLLANRVQRVAK